MNDPTWAEAARVLAARSLEASAEADARLNFAFRRVLGRKPTANEVPVLRRMLEKQLKFYEADGKAAAQVVAVGAAPKQPQLAVTEHAALTAVCLALFNLDEALTRE